MQKRDATLGHESFERSQSLRTSSNRVFGLVFAAFFLVIAVLPWILGDGDVRVWSVIISGGFCAAALLLPAVLAPLNRLWMRFGLLLHRIVNPIVLGVMFFVVVTPTGLLMRAFGKDPLRLRFDREARTYWIPREPPGPAPDSLNHQF